MNTLRNCENVVVAMVLLIDATYEMCYLGAKISGIAVIDPFYDAVSVAGDLLGGDTKI